MCLVMSFENNDIIEVVKRKLKIVEAYKFLYKVIPMRNIQKKEVTPNRSNNHILF